MKKTLCLLIVFILFTACTQTENAKYGEGVVLDVLTSFDKTDGNRATYEQIISEFEQRTGVTINEHSEKSSEDWKKNVISDFNNNEVPDVLFFFTNVPEISSKSVSVETIRSEYPDYAANINPTIMKDLEEKDGQTYAIPVTGFWEAMFINKSLFEGNNIEIPETYDMLLDAVEQFNNLGITPIAASVSFEPHYLFEMLLYNRNGPMLHKKPLLSLEDGNFENWREGLDDFKRLYDMGAFPKDIDITHEGALELFQQKKAAMFVDGSWRTGSIVDTEDCVVIPFPGSEARKSTDLLGGFSMGFYITNEAWENKRDAAVDFVSAMCDKDAIAKFNVNGTASPMALIEITGGSNLIESIMDMNKKATAYIPAVQDNFDPEARIELFKDIRAIVLGEKTSEEALKSFVERSKPVE